MKRRFFPLQQSRRQPPASPRRERGMREYKASISESEAILSELACPNEREDESLIKIGSRS